MRELSLIGWLYVAFACLHAAAPARRPRGWPALRPLAYQATSATFFIVALALAFATFDEITALLVVTTACCAVATLFVLLAPAFPRVAWTSAVLALPSAAALVLGAPHA